MRVILLLDVLSVLPLFLVGGTGALKWILGTALAGAIGLLLSFRQVRGALSLGKQIKISRTTPASTLLALASLLLILPGLISDLLGITLGLLSLALVLQMRNSNYGPPPRSGPGSGSGPHEQSDAEDGVYHDHTTQNPRNKGKGGRIVEADYNTLDENRNTTDENQDDA